MSVEIVLGKTVAAASSGTTFWELISATVIGGLISSVTAYFLHQKQVRDREISGAFGTLIKLNELVNGLYSVRRHIDEMFDQNADKEYPLTEAWAIVQSFASGFEKIDNIDPRNSGFLLKAKESEISSRISLFERRYVALHDSLEVYSRMRQEFFCSSSF